MAVLATATVSLALAIVAIGMIVAGLTQGSRYATGAAPPNVGELGRGQLIAGIVVLAFAVVQIALAGLIVADWRPARLLAAIANGVAAAIAALAALSVLRGAVGVDLAIAAALGLLAALFVGATIVLVTSLRRRAATTA